MPSGWGNLSPIFGATQEHLCSADLEDQEADQEDYETKRTGVVDSSLAVAYIRWSKGGGVDPPLAFLLGFRPL